MDAVDWFYAQPGFHAQRPAAQAPKAAKAPKPRIEATGGGWYKVSGGANGPVDRYGRVAAEQELSLVREALGGGQ